MGWKFEHNFLVYNDRSFITNNSWSILIPMNVSTDIQVGKYNDVTGYVDCLNSAEIQIKSSENDCFLLLDWNFLENKNNFYLSLKRNTYIPKTRYKDKSYCSMSGNLEQQFMEWEKSIEDQYYNNSPYDVLSFLKPEESELNKSKVKQKFMDVRSIYEENGIIIANISHWGGPFLPWQFLGSLDHQGLFQGMCTFILPVHYYNTTGTHKFLDWSIKFFSGTFDHGSLNGVVLILTWNAAKIFATFKDSELHGPAVGFGRIPIFDIDVRSCFVTEIELRPSIGSLEIWLGSLENSPARARSRSKMLEKNCSIFAQIER